MKNNLISVKKAAELLGVTIVTLRNWDKSGKLVAQRTKGGHRRYLYSDIKKLQGIIVFDNNVIKPVVVYCRVSSQDQKKNGDLDRQKARLLEYCVNNKLIVSAVFVEVCSGMKAERPKLNKLYKLITEREISAVVVEYKDRLTRFLFPVFKTFFNSYGVEIIVVEKVFPKSFENELVEDILSLLSSFSGRIYGKRSADRRKKKNDKKNDSQS